LLAKEEYESIFGEQPKEDLFGDDPAPKIEMPHDAPLQPTVFQVPGQGPFIGGSEADTQTAPPDGLQPMAYGQDGAGMYDGGAGTPMEGAEPGWSPSNKPSLSAGAGQRAVAAAAAGSGSQVLVWILAFLANYALLMTGVAIYSYIKLSRIPHPLEMMRDIEGQNKGGRRGGGTQTILYDRPPVDSPLPPRLKIAIGHSVRVGDLEVTALKIERKKVVIKSNANDDFQPTEESLILSLRLKNISTNTYFKPTDPYFERRFRPEESATRPYDFIELLATGKRYWGGPIEWEGTKKDSDRIEWLEGQENPLKAKDLAPGEEMTTVVATSFEDGLARVLKSYQGAILWRVQLRRGLVEFNGKDVATTAVIGVEFTDRDIESVQSS
jgi:hypothetical protein